MRKLFKHISVIVKRSSKRAVFLYVITILVTPLCFIYTTYENFEFVLAELLTFLSFLAGGNIYESIKKNNGKS